MADQPENVFGNEEGGNPTEVKPSTPPAVDYADRLAAIKNEDGVQKYDSLEKALEALKHSQEYIPELKGKVSQYEQELALVKAKLEERESVEEVIARLSASKPEGNGTPPDTKGLDEQTVLNLFEKQLAQRESASRAASNLQAVNDAIVKTYGDKAKEVVAEKAKQLGLQPADFEAMAKEKPNVVLELFKAQGVKSPNPTTNSMNIPGIPRKKEDGPIEKTAKSMLLGTTSKQDKEYMLRIQEAVYAKHGITKD